MLQEINLNSSLVPGDKIEVHAKAWGSGTWTRAAQLAMIMSNIESKRRSDTRFSLSSYVTTDTGFILRFVINAAPNLPVRYESGVNPALIVAAIGVGVAGLFAWLSLDKIYKIVDTPGGQVLAAGSGIGFALLGIVAVITLLTMKKGKP